MPDSDIVSGHYTHGGLLDAIRAGVERLGKSPDSVSVDDLGPVDEFHIGGRAATEGFLEQLDLEPDDHVLDVGCGLGGACRFVAKRYGSQVTGIDLTREYVETGRALCAWTGLEQRVTLDRGNATATPYPADRFDKAYMMHVGMNIADKPGLAREIHRVLKPGGRLGIYDIMRVGDGELSLPVPWAMTADANALEPREAYATALAAAGFRIVAERNRRAFAEEFFAAFKARLAAAGGPPPLGLHILLGEAAPLKIANMIENIAAGRIAPVELIAEKAP
jgi:ubiquinone/menaquinone biosynthesis C-methylase UbiE